MVSSWRFLSAATAWRRAFLWAALETRLLLSLVGCEERSAAEEEEAMRDTKAECLMSCLSRLVSRKASSTTEFGRWTLRGAKGLVRRSAALRRRVLRFDGAAGGIGTFLNVVGRAD